MVHSKVNMVLSTVVIISYTSLQALLSLFRDRLKVDMDMDCSILPFTDHLNVGMVVSAPIQGILILQEILV